MKNIEKYRKTEAFIESLEPMAGSLFVDAMKKSLGICLKNSILEGLNEENSMKIDWQKFKDPMIQSGVSLMKEINAAGYEAYVVGGAVRDILMGDSNPHDIDIASNMPIEELKKRYKTIEYGGGEKHGTVIVRYKGNDIEVTQFRLDSSYSDGRRPDSVEFTNSFEEDTKRRDFTINAMGVDADGNVIDYHGGAEDIKAKRLRTVGKARDRFGAANDGDALRMIRAIRFAARFDFNVDQEIIDAIKELKDTIKTKVSVERVYQEIWKTIGYGGKKFGNALRFMNDTGLFSVILPEVTLTNAKIEAVDKADSDDPVINFAILMNDMNKADVNKVGERLTMNNPEKRSIGYIVDGLKVYPLLDKVPNKKLVMDMVMNPDFSKLRKTYIAINDNDVSGIEEIIEKYAMIASKQKEINAIIGSKGVKGQEFSIMTGKVVNWLFDNGIPDMQIIEKFIEANK